MYYTPSSRQKIKNCPPCGGILPLFAIGGTPPQPDSHIEGSNNHHKPHVVTVIKLHQRHVTDVVTRRERTVMLSNTLVSWGVLESKWNEMMLKFVQGHYLVMNVSRLRLKGENFLSIGHCWSKFVGHHDRSVTGLVGQDPTIPPDNRKNSSDDSTICYVWQPPKIIHSIKQASENKSHLAYFLK